MNIHIKRILGTILSLIILCAIVVAAIKLPAVKNYMFPGQNPIVNVDYSWVGPNDVEIKPFIQSAIPHGYSLYIYKVEPIDREENSYYIPEDDQWVFVDSTSGLDGKVTITVNHTEIVEAVCIRTGTDPRIAFNHDSLDFDTADTMEFRINIDCR